MLNWLKSFFVLAIILMSGATRTPLEAQVGDTITVTIVGNVTGVVLTAEYVTPARVGDTVIFRAVVTDEDGDPINALIRFGVEDPTVLRLEAITDSTVAANEGLARGIALRKATTRVWVGASPISEMRLASFRDGALNWSGHDSIQIHRDAGGAVIPELSSLQYCAYLTRGTTLILQDPLPPDCPIVFLPEPGPEQMPYLAAATVRRSSSEDWREVCQSIRVRIKAR